MNGVGLRRDAPWWSLATVCTILFLTFLDNTIVTVTLARIQTELGPGVTALQWIIDGYMLVFAALMLTGGTLGDLFGRKKVMLGGVAVFCAGSVIAATARSADQIIVGRVVMGVGAAASEPGTLSMIRQLYVDDRARAHALGAWAAVSGAALAFGPVVGGVLIGFGGWPDVFWFNLAFGAAVFFAALITLPENSDPQGRKLDVTGLFLGAGAITAATFAIIQGELSGFDSWWIETLFALSVVLAAAFVVVERRTADPVLRLEFFRRAPFTGANIVAFTTNFGVIAVFFFVVLDLAVINSFTGFDIALQFLSMAVAMVAGAGVAGWWVALVGPRVPTTLGCALSGVGMFVVDAVVGPVVNDWELAGSLFIVGAGFGLTLVTMTTTVLGVVPPERSGMAASTVNTFRELGGVFGTAVLGAIVNAQLHAHITSELKKLGLGNFTQFILSQVEGNGLQKNKGLVNGILHRSGGGGGGGGGQITCAANDLACLALKTAYDAFYVGLHYALVISGALLLASVPVGWFLVRERGGGQPKAPWAARQGATSAS